MHPQPGWKDRHRPLTDHTQNAFLRAFGLAVLAGLGAFPTAILIILAVIIGNKVDQALGMPFPVFLLLMLAVAIPSSIAIMMFLARGAIRAAVGKTDPTSVKRTTPPNEEDEI